MSDTNLRSQVLFTLVLMPLCFGIWYAAGGLLAGPAVWLADVVLTMLLPSFTSETFTEDALFVVVTHYGEVNGAITAADAAGYGMAFKINTRLVSYAIPFYAALLWGSRIDDALGRFGTGLLVLWAAMALGLVAMTMKDGMLVIGEPFMNTAWVPHGNVIGVLYQFSVLLAPTLVPVLLWGAQLRGTPLWIAFSNRLGKAR